MQTFPRVYLRRYLFIYFNSNNVFLLSSSTYYNLRISKRKVISIADVSHGSFGSLTKCISQTTKRRHFVYSINMIFLTIKFRFKTIRQEHSTERFTKIPNHTFIGIAVNNLFHSRELCLWIDWHKVYNFYICTLIIRL